MKIRVVSWVKIMEIFHDGKMVKRKMENKENIIRRGD